MQPNVLIVFADQMRADTMGCAGHPVVQTPSLDRLARDGVHFTNAYTPDPVCVPARASLTTGNYPHKCTGTKANGGRIQDDQTKIAELFARNGYATYASGKLHYVPYSAPGEPRLVHGFDHVALHESGRVVGRFDRTGATPGLEDYHDFLKTVGWGGYERAHGIGNNDIHPAPSPLPEEYYADTWVCDRALDYLDQHDAEAEDKPFFMFVSFPKPHAPYDPPRPFDSMYDPRDMPAPHQARETNGHRTPTKFAEMVTHGWDKWSPAMYQVARAHYCGMVTLQDKQIGRILAHLETRDQLDNTIVIYTADHGDLMGDFGFFAKSSFYRGSVDVPLIVHWPKGLSRGRRADQLVGLQDILPTLASLCDITLPQPVDGMDLAPLLKGEPFTEREFFVSYYMEAPSQLYMVTDKDYKYMHSQGGGVEELYDLRNDPDELYNIVERPDVAGRLQAMRERAAAWARTNGDAAAVDGDRLAVSDADALAHVTFDAGVMGWRWF